jgi:hypothetical protein
MARFRHLHAADGHGLDFDWKRSEYADDQWHAKLENGDHLMVNTKPNYNQTPFDGREWGYRIFGPSEPLGGQDYENKQYMHIEEVNGEDEVSEHLASGGYGPTPDARGRGRLTFIDDPHGAMGTAEGHYRSLDRRGAGRPSRDLSVYDDIDGHDDLDEDFGHILGGRRTANGLGFPWRPNKRWTGYEWEEANLENGHQLAVYPHPNDPDEGWDWYLWHGPTQEDGSRDVTGGGRGWDGDDRAHSTEHIPTADHARAAAEAAYSELFPIGTDTGPHESGVDYSDLNKFMGEGL